MTRLEATDFDKIRPHFQQAADQAKQATCLRASCGTVIVDDGQVIGQGFNAPPADQADQQRCNQTFDNALRPKYDKTCCVHAEWRAILDACKRHPNQLSQATLYFMRLDDQHQWTDAGQPFCTACSRLALDSGIAYFALYNNQGCDLYDTSEYDQQSYAPYTTD